MGGCGLVRLRVGTRGGCCEHGNEPSVSTKYSNLLIIWWFIAPASSLCWPARRLSAQNALVSYLSRFEGQRWTECSSMGAFLGSFVAGICLDRTFLDLGSILDFGVTYMDWILCWCQLVWRNHLKNRDYFLFSAGCGSVRIWNLTASTFIFNLGVLPWLASLK